MTAAAKPATVSLAALDLTTLCEANQYEFEYLDTAGRATGVFITVLGSQAPKVQNWIRQRLNQRRAQEAMAAKRGKELQRTVEDDDDFSNEAAAIRIVGWRGITEEYSPALALRLVASNSEIRDQVFRASNDLSHFTKG
jgi:hypothetical protein